MSCGVTSGLGGTGKSEKVIFTVAGEEMADDDFTSLVGSCRSAEGLQPASKASAVRIGIDRIIIVFTSARLRQDGMEFFDASQGMGKLVFARPPCMVADNLMTFVSCSYARLSGTFREI